MSGDRLTDLLGAPLPDGVAALPVATRDELAGLIAAARQSQDDALRACVATTLRLVPFPLRVLIRRVLLG